MSVKIFHNNRCAKSREALQWLETNKKEFEIIYYLDNPPTANELKSVINKLNIPAEVLVRKGEKIFKENFKGKKLTEDQWVAAMIEFPKLIERPIVINDDKAAIGRPLEQIIDLF